MSYRRKNLVRDKEIGKKLIYLGTSLVAQMVKCLSTMPETWVRSLGQEDSLEKETATQSSIFLENPMDGGAWCRLLSMGSQRVGHN